MPRDRKIPLKYGGVQNMDVRIRDVTYWSLLSRDFHHAREII